MQKQAAEIDTYARDNIKDYKKLSSPAQSQIRRIIEDGRAKGVSDSDVLAYAKVAAHSGLDIVFDKEATKVKNKAGEDTYRPAAYEWQKNLITVNPESKKGAESILIHELDHAIRNYFGKDGQRMSKVFGRALAEIDKTTQEEILKNSEEVAKPGQLEKVFKDEVNAYFAERMLTNRQTLERIVKAEPGIKDRILSFFKGASADYADVPKLSGSAKWYYKKFKKMFDDFSARNSEAFVNEKSLTSINQGNMSVSDRQYALNNSTQSLKSDSKNDIISKDNLYTATDEFVREVAPNDRKAFARSLANQTAGMVQGEIRTVYIYSTSKVYAFRADGYMHGEMIESFSPAEYNEKIKSRKEYKDELNSDRKTADLWAKPISDIGRRSGSDISISEGRGRPTFNDILSKDSSKSDTSRNTEREWTNPRTEEEINEALNKLRQMLGLEPVDYSQKSNRQYALPLDVEAKNKIKEKAEKRADETIKRERAKLEARYKTDTEFSQKKIVDTFNKVSALKNIKRKVKADTIRKNRQQFFSLAEEAKSEIYDFDSMSNKQVLRVLLDIAGEIMNDEFDTPNISQIYNKSKGAKKQSATSKKKAKTESVGNSSRRKENVVYSNDIEAENVRLRAEWEGDTVFSEKTVEETLYKKIEQFKYLKKSVRDEIIRDLWRGLNESRSAEER